MQYFIEKGLQSSKRWIATLYILLYIYMIELR